MKENELNQEEIGAEINFSEDGRVTSAVLPSGGELIFDEDGEAELSIPADVPESEREEFKANAIKEYQTSLAKIKNKGMKLNQKEAELKTLESEGKNTKALQKEVEALKDQLATLITTIQSNGNSDNGRKQATPTTNVSGGAMSKKEAFYAELSKLSGRKIRNATDVRNFELEDDDNAELVEDARASADETYYTRLSEQKVNNYAQDTRVQIFEQQIYSKGIDPKAVKDFCKANEMPFNEAGLRLYQHEHKRSGQADFINKINEIKIKGTKIMPDSQTRPVAKEKGAKIAFEILKNLNI
jgi:hypothetical protein